MERPPIEEWEKRFCQPFEQTMTGSLFRYIRHIEAAVMLWYEEALEMGLRMPPVADEVGKAFHAIAEQIPKQKS